MAAKKKKRKGRKVDVFAGKGSTAGKLKTERERKQARLDEIMGRKSKPTKGGRTNKKRKGY